MQTIRLRHSAKEIYCKRKEFDFNFFLLEWTPLPSKKSVTNTNIEKKWTELQTVSLDHCFKA